jgi:hypothetical protein
MSFDAEDVAQKFLARAIQRIEALQAIKTAWENVFELSGPPSERNVQFCNMWTPAFAAWEAEAAACDFALLKQSFFLPLNAASVLSAFEEDEHFMNAMVTFARHPSPVSPELFRDVFLECTANGMGAQKLAQLLTFSSLAFQDSLIPMSSAIKIAAKRGDADLIHALFLFFPESTEEPVFLSALQIATAEGHVDCVQSLLNTDARGIFVGAWRRMHAFAVQVRN